MLYLEIKNGKEESKTSKFQQDTIRTVLYMKIITRGTGGHGQLLSNDTYFSGIWFNGVKNMSMILLWEYIILVW